MSCERCPQCEYCGAYRLGEWTTEPPTEPGWYWALGWCDSPEPTYVIIDGEFIAIMGGDRMTENMLSHVTHWQRIEAPEVPR